MSKDTPRKAEARLVTTITKLKETADHARDESIRVIATTAALSLATYLPERHPIRVTLLQEKQTKPRDLTEPGTYAPAMDAR